LATRASVRYGFGTLMRNKPVLTAAEVRQMLAAARAEAERNGWAVSIAIVDDGGCLLAFERLDGASPQSADVAILKARSAAMMRLPTKALEDIVKERPGLMTMPGVLRVQGGLPIPCGADWVGAVGVAGASSGQDEQVATACIAALSS
jgi:glc operon protein GlcG